MEIRTPPSISKADVVQSFFPEVKMRILLSIHHALNRNAGAAGATVNLAEGLQALGHDVEVISFDDISITSDPLGIRFPLFLALRLLQKPQYDVVDASSGDTWIFLMVRQLFRRLLPKIIVTTRSHGLEHAGEEYFAAHALAHGLSFGPAKRIGRKRFRLWQSAMSYRKAEAAFFLNEAERSFAVSRLSVPSRLAHVVINGVAPLFLRRAAELRQSTERSNSPYNIAVIANFELRKGIDLIVTALTQVMKSDVRVRLGYFGVGVSRDKVLADFPLELHDRIEVIPKYDNHQLPMLIFNYGILAFPSRFEGFALSPLEAMACGLVPIVADVSGTREAVKNGITGVVIPVDDSQALSKSIVALHKDTRQWETMRANGLEEVQIFDWTLIAASTVERYLHIDSC